MLVGTACYKFRANSANGVIANRTGLPKDRTDRLRTPLALFFISLGVVAAVWWWLAMPVTLVRAPIDPAAKLECVSYAPSATIKRRMNADLIVSPEQIAEDLAELAKISKCIRTYSIDNGLDKVPELASRVGLKVLLGVWIGRDRAKNALLVNTAISLAKDHPGVIRRSSSATKCSCAER